MDRELVNWSGSVRLSPDQIESPRDENELVDAVRRAAVQGRRVRVAGALHSSSRIILGDDVLISTEHLKGVVAVDRSVCEATVRSGTLIGEAGPSLREAGLAMHTVGD